ncbi:glycosyltransferase family 2 protein [Methanosphaera cuniculi]|uniref:glycosyltransferase family 2 protein n=1 Tax=Methanosphaera cuniculi TaxID=1077256 RepID=UPI0026DAA9CD|nr:glycosyltransferase family 2 protein [Methanosphaera cuniculi]
MVKISIIMPVYNQAEFLEDTFKSITNQTLKDIEVICVNDGSTDDTQQTLENLKTRYPFIKIYKTENQGSGKARNYGIKQATGEYIAFLDADDSFLDEKALEKMYMYGHKNNADIVCANLRRIKQDRSIEKEYDPKAARFSYFIQKDVLEPVEYGIPWAFYKNIYKTSFIKNNNIQFPDLIRGQDPIFLANILTTLDEIHVINTDLYGYNHSVSGGVNVKTDTYEKKEAYIQHFKDTMDILKDAGFESPLREYKKEFINYLKFQDNLNDEQLQQIVPKIFNNPDEYFQDDEMFFIKYLENPETNPELDEFKEIKKCLFEEVLLSDNFIGYDMLQKYLKYKDELKDKYPEDEVRKASYNVIQKIATDVNQEYETLMDDTEKLDKQIRKQRKIKDEIMTSNSWKMTEVLRNLRNRNK